jgi:hypothetical protein
VLFGGRFVEDVAEVSGYLMLFYKVWNSDLMIERVLPFGQRHVENLPAALDLFYAQQAAEHVVNHHLHTPWLHSSLMAILGASISCCMVQPYQHSASTNLL